MVGAPVSVPTPPVYSLFVSCFNEAHVIGRTLDKVSEIVARVGQPSEVIIIDDASSDGSIDILRAYRRRASFPLRIFRNEVNVGLARNFFWAAKLGRGTYFRIVWGGDITPIETHCALHAAMGRADIIVPDYSAATGGSLFRRLLSRAFVFLVNLFSGLPIRYYNGGAMFKRDDVVNAQISTSGFGFQAELIVALIMAGRSHVEIPLNAVRDIESSSVNWRNFLSIAHSFLKILGWRLIRRPPTLDMPRICKEIPPEKDEG